ncbi:MAG: archease [Candidatus Omnitrophica bacterium]|nr:archease [Candidatus Omnitrophota bacterium]
MEIMRRYEQIPHTADLAARIYGETLPELFANAAFAMFELIGEAVEGSRGEKSNVELEGADLEDILIRWLNELLYISFHNKIKLTRFEIKSLTGERIKAEVSGRPFSAIIHEIKAATYHDVTISKTHQVYSVTIVFDI